MMTKIEDPILKKIVEQVLQHCNPKKIVLFGSRARGDYREKSDYDISVSGINESNYAEVLNAIDDNDYTLRKIDLLKYENLNEEYQNSVNTEGITLYEQG